MNVKFTYVLTVWLVILIQSPVSWSQNSPNFGCFKHYLEEDGLSDNEVTSLAQDSLGFIWIGTQYGLNRFDGTTFKHFYPDGTKNSLCESKVNHLQVASNGILWIATENGVNSYDPTTEKFKFYENIRADGQQHSRAESVIEDKHGKIWIAYEDLAPSKGGISCLDPISGEFENFEVKDLIGAMFLALYKKDPTKIVIAGKGNMILFNSETNESYTIPEYPFDYKRYHTDCVEFYDENTIIHGGVNTNLWLYHIQDKKHSKIPNTEGTIRSFIKHKNGYYLLTYKNGLGYYDIEKDTTTYWDFEDNTRFAVPSRWPRQLLEDNDGRIWIGHYDGLSILDPRSQHVKNRNLQSTLNTLNDKTTTIMASYVNQDNQELIIGESIMKGITTLDMNSFGVKQRYSFYTSGPFKGEKIVVKDFIKNNMDSIYMLTSKGVFNMHRRNFGMDCIYRVDQLKKEVRWFDFDKEKGLLVLSYGFVDHEFLLINLETKEEKIIQVPDVFNASDYPRKPKFHGDKIWLQTYSGTGYYDLGYNQFFSIEEIIDDINVENLPFLNSVAPYNDSIVYFSAQLNGILEINLNQKSHTWVAPFYNNASYWTSDLVIDSKKNIWAIMSKGLVKYDPKTKEHDYFFGDWGFGHINWYISKLWLQEDDLLVGKRRSSLFWTKLDGLENEKSYPNISISNVSVSGIDKKFDKSLGFLSEIELDEGPLNFAVDFNDLQINPPRSINYAFKMIPGDDTWNFIGNHKKAFFQNIQGGTYQLYISEESAIRDDKTPYKMEIFIPTKFRDTLLFKIIIFGLLLIFVFLISRYFRQKRIEKQRLQSEFEKQLAEVEMTALRAQMNPHFLFNSLNSIKYYIIKNKSEEAAEYLTKFSRLIRLILNNSRSELVPLDQEIEALDLYIQMESLRFEQGFEFDLIYPETVKSLDLSIPPLLIQPYVENSIWHGLMHKETKGKLIVEFSIQWDRLFCSIIDDGIGREAASRIKSKSSLKNKSHGLNITSKRLDYINEIYKTNSQLEIKDLKDEKGMPTGTQVLISIPKMHEKN